MTEQELQAIIARGCSVAEAHKPVKLDGKTVKKKLVIVLPLPLPTWNRLLAMNHWQRKKTRDLLHRAVSICTRYAIEPRTSGGLVKKLSLTDSLQLQRIRTAYFPMIRPGTSTASPTPGKLSGKRRKKW